MKRRKRKKDKHEDYACVFCKFEFEDYDKGCEPIIKRGQIRVKLVSVGASTTLYACPKCKKQHVTKDFKVQGAEQKIREKRRKRNIQHLQQLYQPFLGDN